jgi:Leucine-rich repeat (LRR) protein
MVWQKALMDASISKGICNMSWLNFGQIDPVVYDFQKNYKFPLKELRLVGMGLTEIPDDMGNKLKTLEVLSLTSNQLTTLPDNIVNLTKIRELQLVKNKIEYLPDRIGLLASLITLGLAKNCIKRLPLTFAALNLIIRVDLECNDLKFLPENLDHMVSCSYFNVNNNKLFRLPKCIGRMPSLKVFSASLNSITYIPEEICDNKTIKTLRLAVNKLTKLPDNLGNLTRLEELTVDYNEIIKIPNTVRMLKKLRILRIEGNNLRDPPDKIVLNGAISVVEYFQALYDSDVQWRMRLVVTSLQNVLRQLIERDMYDPSMLEPDTILPHDTQKDLWTAIDQKYLIDKCLPDLRLVWRQEGLQKGGRKNTGYISNFPYTEKDIIWACSGFGDAFGPVMTKMKANFKKCSCLDKNGRRKPCQPPMIVSTPNLLFYVLY